MRYSLDPEMLRFLPFKHDRSTIPYILKNLDYSDRFLV